MIKSQCLLEQGDSVGAEAALPPIHRRSDDPDTWPNQVDQLLGTASILRRLDHIEEALAAIVEGLAAVLKPAPFGEQAVRLLMAGAQLTFDRRIDLTVALNIAAIAALDAPHHHRLQRISPEFRRVPHTPGGLRTARRHPDAH
jgi:hypothetical protein